MGLAKDKIILALDYSTKEAAVEMVKKLLPYVGVFKVGFELFIACGPSIIKEINALGCKVFLDLKLCDIPNTVGKAVEVINSLDVFMFNVHASGGLEMMRRAADTISKNNKKPIAVAVTVLTSLNSEILNEEIGIKFGIKEQVIQLAKLAKSAGLDGVVAAGEEIKEIREECGPDFKIVTPGIRLLSLKNQDDQKRIVTPKDAVNAGADFIVIGRPVTKAEDPVSVAKNVLKEIG